MTGLQTKQSITVNKFAVGQNSGANTTIHEICSPSWFNASSLTPFSGASNGTQKVFLKTATRLVMYYNHTNLPILCSTTYYRYRKNVPISAYSTIGALISNNVSNGGLSVWWSSLTTSPTAQRFLRWIKTKRWILYPNTAKYFKLKAVYKSPKQISDDVEANTQYLGTYMTVGHFTQFCGLPMVDVNGNQESAGTNVMYCYRDVISYYDIEQDTAASTVNAYTAPTQVALTSVNTETTTQAVAV